MISRAWSLREIFFAGGIPALLAALAIALSYGLRAGHNPYQLALPIRKLDSAEA